MKPMRLYDHRTAICNATAECANEAVATVETIHDGARFGTSMCRNHVDMYLNWMIEGSAVDGRSTVYAIRPYRAPEEK